MLDMKLVTVLKALLGVQLAAFGCALSILYLASQDAVSNFDGLRALIPLYAFNILALVNIILLITYLARLASKRLSADYVLFTLVAVNILLVVFANPIIQWAAQ